MIRKFSILAAALLVSGCATVIFEAPKDKELYLGSSEDDYTLSNQGRVWYLIGGLIPITSNSTASMQPGLFSTSKSSSTSITGVCSDNSKVYFVSQIGVVDYILMVAASTVLSTATFCCGGIGGLLTPYVLSVEAYCK